MCKGELQVIREAAEENMTEDIIKMINKYVKVMSIPIPGEEEKNNEN